MNCLECRAVLSQEEFSLYKFRCTACEQAWQSRVQSWNNGKMDHELETLFRRLGPQPFTQQGSAHEPMAKPDHRARHRKA